MKKLLSLLVVLSMIALSLWAGGKKEAPASAQKFTLRISTVISTSDPMYKGYALLAENLGKRTNGDDPGYRVSGRATRAG